MFGEMEAIDSLLQQLAYYKRHDPNQVEVSQFASVLVPTEGRYQVCVSDPNFYFDADPDLDLDPDLSQNDADPLADPTPSFTNV